MRWFGHTGDDNDPDVRSAPRLDYQFRDGSLNFNHFDLPGGVTQNPKSDQSNLNYLR